MSVKHSTRANLVNYYRSIPKVILGVGLPGSGKTSALKPFAEKYSHTYISPDDIRAELLGDTANQSKNREVWDEAYKRTAEALQEGKTVVFDATFAKGTERRSFIDFVRAHGADKVQGVFAAVPLEIAGERNRLRERVVPEHAMERMSAMLKDEPPVMEDGFDSLFDINEFQKMNHAETQIDKGVLVKEFKPKLQ